MLNTLDVIHRIEDLQVVGFAVVFGIMAFQSRRDRVLRYLLFSYLLGSVVSMTDVIHTGLSHRVQMFTNLALISLRYGYMMLALAQFANAKKWFSYVAFAIALLPVADVALTATHATADTLLLLTYSAMALQYLLLAGMLLTRREKPTRVPRCTLAALFLVSVFIRSVLILTILRPSPGLIWFRDQLWFINSAVVGCITPFTIIWMMNARVHSDLRKQSLMDPLTGLMNRRGLQQAVTREMARYGRGRQDFAVAIADIDHFKALNDTHGHSCGDLVLRAFAGICQSTLRQTDVIARTGGEEFTMLLPVNSDAEMHAVLDRVRTRLAEHVFATAAGGGEVRSTVSIGVTGTAGRLDITWEQLMHEADAALYEAKRTGRNRTVDSGVPRDATDVLDDTLPVA